MFLFIKRKIPKKLKIFLKSSLLFFRKKITSIKRKTKKMARVIFKNNMTTKKYSFSILCIKKTVYADLLIENINSLHYINNNHDVTIYCDNLCYEYLIKNKNKFNYREKVSFVDSFQNTDKPWQVYKIETIIRSSMNDQILNDADGIWHEDPNIDINKVTLLVSAYDMNNSESDLMVIDNIIKKADCKKFKHYVTGFVYIPKNLLTDKVIDDMRKINDQILSNKLDFVDTDTKRNSIRRLSEEFAVNFAIQLNIKPVLINTLKTEDGPGSKKLLQSLYYGCLNEVIE